jgi:hypothetical protein
LYGSGKKDLIEIEEQDKDLHDTSLKTFRIMEDLKPDRKVPTSTLDEFANDGTVIIYDLTPSKLRFTSENEGKFSIIKYT